MRGGSRICAPTSPRSRASGRRRQSSRSGTTARFSRGRTSTPCRSRRPTTGTRRSRSRRRSQASTSTCRSRRRSLSTRDGSFRTPFRRRGGRSCSARSSAPRASSRRPARSCARAVSGRSNLSRWVCRAIPAAVRRGRCPSPPRSTTIPGSAPRRRSSTPRTACTANTPTSPGRSTRVPAGSDASSSARA